MDESPGSSFRSDGRGWRRRQESSVAGNKSHPLQLPDLFSFAPGRRGGGLKSKPAFTIARSFFLPNRNAAWWAAGCWPVVLPAFSQILKSSFLNRFDTKRRSNPTPLG